MNKIFIISGPSGIGKGTIEKMLLEKSDLDLVWAKSYTTRLQRESDKTENHYFFVDEQKFKELEVTGEILESNFYNNNWYGTSLSDLNNTLDSGKNALKEIEVNGGKFYKKKLPDSVLIFIKSDLENIKNRLTLRGQNTKQEIEDRLKITKDEIEQAKIYDYIIENPEGHPELAAQEIADIIRKEINGNS